MERGNRRLLHDLHAVGRALEERPPARERLRSELGAHLSRKLLQESTHRRRRIA
jgi:hypothetical protein